MIDILKFKSNPKNHKDSYSGAEINTLIQNAYNLKILYFSIQDFATLNSMYGEEWANDVCLKIKNLLLADARTSFKHNDFHIFSFNAGEFFLIDPCNKKHSLNLNEYAYQFKVNIENSLKSDQISKTGSKLVLTSGFSKFKPTCKNSGLWSTFLSAMGEARLEAQKTADFSKLELSQEFCDILNSNEIVSHYQPIINLKEKTIHGWEALARGPVHSPFRSPLTLFDMAEKLGKLFQLGRACRKSAIKCFGDFRPDQKLFLNIHPRTIVDPNFSTGETKLLLDRIGLKPSNIVFEITERHSVKDFGSFRRTLDHYRNQGYLVAIDDAGTGYSGISSIAEINPDYIKLDRSFVNNIASSRVNRAIVDTFTEFADKIKAKLIVEGIETKEQALIVLELGAHMAQGYFYARPEATKPQIPNTKLNLTSQSLTANQTRQCGIPVKNLVQKTTSISELTPVLKVKQLFKTGNVQNSVVVTKNNAPLGLIMEYRLNKQLSGKYGVALYSNKPVSTVMDYDPLIVTAETTVEKVSKLAMARNRKQTYDDIIVTSESNLLGIVSVQRLLDTLAHVQVEMAKGTNPLTGLPGNLDIEKEIEKRINKNQKYSIIYADLDNFKVYNDTYGFKNGDKIILQIAQIIKWAIAKHNSELNFIGHIGGDDFVLITHPKLAEKICISITRCFKKLARYNYNECDRRNGYMKGKGRDGETRNFPIVSVSLAILDCAPSQNLHDIGQFAASLKKWAKSIEGNCWVRERRKKPH